MPDAEAVRVAGPCSRLRQDLLDALTGTPPTDGGERFFHDDLRWMQVGELRREAAAARLQLLFSSRPNPWWIARLQRIQELLDAS